MKVFIGWSGQRSQAMAIALRDWLPLVLHYVEPWISETDIAAGERWADAIAKELEAANFGILCVTRENLNSPWILFEAGSLAKSFSNSRVIPLLLDLDFTEVTGPLAQFQAKKVDEEGVSETVHSINRAADLQVPESRATQLFDALWPDLQKKLESLPPPKDPTKPARSQHQILEELVATVRSLESRLRELSDSSSRTSISKHRRFSRMHPMMLADMLDAKPGDPIIFLIFASLIRDELPWLYELALETYRCARSGNQEESRQAVDRIKRVSRFLLDGPMLEESGLDPRMLHMTVRELERLADFASTPPQPPSEKKPRRPRSPKTT